ncbi:hypothetical protein V2J09_003499 [Rumex salicifolius]
MRRPHYDIGRHEATAMDSEANKGSWSKQEDEKLISYIHTHGEGCWRTIPQAAGLLRCGKSCRLRWVNYLKPGLKRGNFSEDEQDLIIKLHALLGNRWSLIAGRLPGRTDNEIKNYWNTHLRRKLLNIGLDPNNHRLNQTLARLKTSQQSLKSVTINAGDCLDKVLSKSSMRDEGGNLDEQVSDSGSCLLQDGNSTTNTELPDLNLDLNLMTNSSTDLGTSCVVVKSEQQGICNDSSMILREIESRPTSPFHFNF